MNNLKSESPNLEYSVKRFSTASLLIVFFLTLLGLFALPRLQTQYSLKQFLPKESPLLKKDERARQVFQLSEAQPFIITARLYETMLGANAPTWLSPSRIQNLEKLTELLGHFPGVKNTLSIATAEGAVSNKGGLSVGPLLKSLSPEKWQPEVLKNPLLSPTLLSRDELTVSLIVNIHPLNTKDLLKLRQNLEVTARAALPFAQVEIGGTPAVQTDVGVLLQTEVRNFVLLGFVACFIVLGLVFSNWSPLIISFIIILSANILVLAVMALAGYPFSILSSTIPILTTVDVVSLCIHTLLRFSEEKRNRPQFSQSELVRHTFRVLLGPNLVASMTTMIGFLALLAVKVPLIRDYGITAAVAIVIGWIVTTMLLFPLLYFLPAPRARTWAWRKARWALHLFRRSGVWALLIVLVASALAIKGQSLSWSARLFDDLPENHQVRLSTETIDNKLGGMIPVDLEIKGPTEIWNEPAFISNLDELMNEIRKLNGVGSVVGLPDLVAATNITSTRLPASRSSTAEIYFLYSLSAENPLNHFLNTDASSTRLAVRTKDLPANELQTLVGEIKFITAKKFPQMTLNITGMGSTIHHLNDDLSRELIFGFWQSMAAICLLLCFVFRSWQWAVVACIPNLIPPAALLGFLAISQTPIKPSVAIIFSIALGLAFNNTVYLLERLRLMQKNRNSKNLEIEKALWKEGNPCLISSLILLAGFSVFLASYFALNRIFGFYMLISMLAGLVGDLILLPTLLKSCPWLLTPIPWKKEKIMTSTSFLFLMILASFSLLPVKAQTTPAPQNQEAITKAQQIGTEVRTRLKARDEEFLVTMKIIEKDNSSKERHMQISRLSPQSDEHFFLVKMLKPQDLKGTALLAVMKGNQEDKWIYLPSSKQTRRLTGENNKGGILGSELSVEDFDFNKDENTQSVLKREVVVGGKKYYVIESDVNGSSANYSRVVSYISATDFLPVKAECFDKQGQLLKILDISGYKKITATKWRAGKIKIRNVQNNRGTEITLSQIKLDQNLKNSRFTPKALSLD